MHGDRRPAELSHSRFEANHIADQHRFLELNTVESDCDHLDCGRSAAKDDFAPGRSSPRHVDVTQNDAAEDGAVRIGVPRHHHDLDGGIWFGHCGSQMAGMVRGTLQVKGKKSGSRVATAPTSDGVAWFAPALARFARV